MFNAKLKTELAECQAQLMQERLRNNAIDETMATIEFEPDGTIITASQPFLATVGYSLIDIQGQHHRKFCDSSYANSEEYRKFWRDLAAGESRSGKMKCYNSQSDELWLESTYFPIKDDFGKVERVMKIAADITDEYKRAEQTDSVLEALNRALTSIEFLPDGTIIDANENFLSAFGYKLEQIKGQPHRMLCPDAFYQDNPNFWGELGTGSFKSGLFEHVSASGESIWLESSYNPIIKDGKIVRVVKIGSDISVRIRRNIEVQRITEVASTSSQETSEKAQNGMKTLSEAVDTSQKVSDVVSNFASEVEELNQQFKNIENIVATIKSIADQTNLLALNAAIEAARAGEQGRGFAVVADEVRQLAARTSESTEEIESMVLTNHKMMAGIMDEIGRVDKISNEGLVNISKVTDIMNEIQQGSESVAKSVAQLNKD